MKLMKYMGPRMEEQACNPAKSKSPTSIRNKVKLNIINKIN